MKKLLIIGAGPYGLATAGAALDRGINFDLVGVPMGLWRESMPKGMILRTTRKEHFDVADHLTMDAFIAENQYQLKDFIPLTLARYLDYADWFIKKKGIQVSNDVIIRLERNDQNFVAESRSGRVYHAERVLVAIGVRDFKYVPPELSKLVPQGRFSHTVEVSDPEQYCSKKVLIVGGRQSAFELAALLAEAGAKSVHVVCRHSLPDFTRSDFSFMNQLVEEVENNPCWYKELSAEKKKEWEKFAYEQGRLKLEPWLKPRLEKSNVRTWPESQLTSVTLKGDQSLAVNLNNGNTVDCDHIVFATGYRPDISQVRFLKNSSLFSKFKVQNGSPALHGIFESSFEGLHFMGFLSIADFGFPFGFSTGARAAARIFISDMLRAEQS